MLRAFALVYMTYNITITIKTSVKKANVRRRKRGDKKEQRMSDVSYFSRLLYDRQDERNMSSQNNIERSFLERI